MPIGITEEHEELRLVARRWVDSSCDSAVARAALEAPREERPPFWPSLGDLGWLGLHVEERYGGGGYGLPELAVVLEELGRACAPGPFVLCVAAAAAIQAGGSEAAAKALLPDIVA